MATKSIKVSGKSINYDVQTQTINTVTFSDGVVLTITGSVAAAVVLAAYNAYKKANPTPVVVAPTPPVIIVKPSPGAPTEISAKDAANLHDIEGVNFLVKEAMATEAFNLSNLKNVNIDASKVSITTNYRAVILSGLMQGVTLDGLSLKDVPDYQIYAQGYDKVKYTGQAGSFIDGLTLSNIKVTGGGAMFHMDGNLIAGVYDGVMKNFKMFGCSVKDCADPGDVVYLGNAYGYEIYNNVISNVNYLYTDPNAPNGRHNGLFHIKGAGSFHDNLFSEHQGNILRAWIQSLDAPGEILEAYGNIAYNSHKYGAFELQATPDMVANGYKPANAIIRNNVAGHLNVVKDWAGELLDLYNTGGTVDVHDNIGFDLNRWADNKTVNTGITNMINNMSDGTNTKLTESNNVYYDTMAIALAKSSTIQSLASKITI